MLRDQSSAQMGNHRESALSRQVKSVGLQGKINISRLLLASFSR
jgi:hypothetical protein